MQRRLDLAVADDFSRWKKRTAGLLVGDRGGEPTVQVARPLLGDRRCCLGGGDCQRNIISSKHCASEKLSENRGAVDGFFLFLRCELIGIVERPRFLTNIPSFATCEMSALVQAADPAIRCGCILQTAGGRLRSSDESCVEATSSLEDSEGVLVEALAIV